MLSSLKRLLKMIEHRMFMLLQPDARTYRHKSPTSTDPKEIRRELIDAYFLRQPSLLASVMLRVYLKTKSVTKRVLRIMFRRGK